MSQRQYALWLLGALLISLPATQSCGEVFAFDVPALLGTYKNAHREVAVDLGRSFSQIDSVSLRLQGDQAVGLYGYLNSPRLFPYPAELVGGLPELEYPVITGFDEVLPDRSGPFDVTLPFERWLDPHLGIDFSPLLDGKAQLDLSASGPPLVAITYVASHPTVVVDSATLIVDGVSVLAVLAGDYNGDGAVDETDLAVWRETYDTSIDLRADGNGNGIVDTGDFTVWRDAMHSGGAGALGSTGAVPEPSSLVLTVAIGWITLLGRKRLSITAAA